MSCMTIPVQNNIVQRGDSGNIMREGGRAVGGFGQFYDTMSQYGHLVSCMTILL